ncbi:MAG TPA: shikimate dehydrogenase [Candidatus Thioglobus sp.]|jgi:shikimate dehydrogenase|nr:shikimate dehydrogenase [Candidatus Thioglobus sp.]
MDLYGVLGNPIEHSLSPEIHTQFSQQTGCEIIYKRVLAPLDGFSSTAESFINKGAKGFSITVPFKLDAFDLATDLTDNAKAAGAVNTIKISEGRIIGENTDGIGLVNDLTSNLNVTLKNKVVLVLGAGGATQGLLLPLLNEQPRRLMIANRTRSKAKKMKHDFAQYGETCGFGLDEIKNEPVDIIINATSASLHGEMPDIANGVADGAICYDLMYGNQTPFMDWAEKNNAQMVIDGLGMLIEQAAVAFEFWTGKKPKTGQVFKELRR